MKKAVKKKTVKARETRDWTLEEKTEQLKRAIENFYGFDVGTLKSFVLGCEFTDTIEVTNHGSKLKTLAVAQLLVTKLSVEILSKAQ